MVAPLRTVETAARPYVLRLEIDGIVYEYDATDRLQSVLIGIVAILRDKTPGGAGWLGTLEAGLRWVLSRAMPFLGPQIEQARTDPRWLAAFPLLGQLPPFPPLPKHADPMEHLAAWIVTAAFSLLGTGTYVLTPEDAGGYVDAERDVIVLPITGLRWDAPATRYAGQEGAWGAEEVSTYPRDRLVPLRLLSAPQEGTEREADGEEAADAGD